MNSFKFIQFSLFLQIAGNVQISNNSMWFTNNTFVVNENDDKQERRDLENPDALNNGHIQKPNANSPYIHNLFDLSHATINNDVAGDINLSLGNMTGMGGYIAQNPHYVTTSASPPPIRAESEEYNGETEDFNQVNDYQQNNVKVPDFTPVKINENESDGISGSFRKRVLL